MARNKTENREERNCFGDIVFGRNVFENLTNDYRSGFRATDVSSTSTVTVDSKIHNVRIDFQVHFPRKRNFPRNLVTLLFSSKA